MPVRRSLYLLGTLLLSLILLDGCGSSREAQVQARLSSPDSLAVGNDSQSEGYVIKPGDQVRIIVQGYPELDTTLVVAANGSIKHRLIGDIHAAGLTQSELMNELRPRFSQFIRSDAAISLSVLNPTIQSVAVLGAVRNQGNYPVTSKMTILQVLAAAGGSTEDSDLSHVKIFRGGDYTHPIEVDIGGFIASRETKSLPLVGGGDIVFVPKMENFIRDMSNFLRDTLFLFSVFTLVH